MNVNKILKIYLGANKDGGIMPVGKIERLKENYPKTYKEEETKIKKYLEFYPKIDQAYSSEHILLIFEKELKNEFPELDDISVKALTNDLAYSRK